MLFLKLLHWVQSHVRLQAGGTVLHLWLAGDWWHTASLWMFFCSSFTKELPTLYARHQAGRPQAQVYRLLRCGRDAQLPRMRKGGGGHLYDEYISPVEWGSVALLFLDWKIRSPVFRARGIQSGLLPLDYIASSCWYRDVVWFWFFFLPSNLPSLL